MTMQWGRVAPRDGVRRLLAMTVVAFALYGCKGAGTQEAPPAAPPEEAVVTTPGPSTDVQRYEDEFGNPLNPTTGMPLERVFYFEYDRAVLTPESLVALEAHAAHLRGSPEKRVMVEGHCDERGTREYNLALGERRGDAARTFLVSSGVSRSQIEVVSYGEERPVDPGHSESAWAQNRRAELIYR